MLITIILALIAIFAVYVMNRRKDEVLKRQIVCGGESSAGSQVNQKETMRSILKDMPHNRNTVALDIQQRLTFALFDQLFYFQISGPTIYYPRDCYYNAQCLKHY